MTTLLKTRPPMRLSRAAMSYVVASLVAAVQCMPAEAATVPKPAAQAAVAPDVDQSRIGAGDMVRITVYQSPDLSLETRVNEGGVISYPLLGRVQLGGMTINAAEAHLASELKRRDFVKDPQVIIVVTQVRASQVNVLGQVGHPGRFPLDLVGMRLTEILALAGGIIAGAGSDTVVIQGQRDGHAFRREVDLPRIFAQGGSDGDIPIMPGDTIWVDRAPTIYMYGEIQHPGTSRLERGMTLMQAVAAGGGATQRGTLKGIRITRRGPDGKLQTIEPAMDDTLKDGDVVFIRESLF